MSITWDWIHSNDVKYKVKRKDGREGVCTSKSFFWVKKVLERRGPLPSRMFFDAGTGVGVTPQALAAQALHARATQKQVHSPRGANWGLPFHSSVAVGYGLSVVSEGSGSGPKHDAWIEHVYNGRGKAYVLTIQGRSYYHTVALWRASALTGSSALFDSEAGQYSTVRKTKFKATVGAYFDAEYPGLTRWELYSVSR